MYLVPAVVVTWGKDVAFAVITLALDASVSSSCFAFASAPVDSSFASGSATTQFLIGQAVS
jgi:hypothetical protein